MHYLLNRGWGTVHNLPYSDDIREVGGKLKMLDVFAIRATTEQEERTTVHVFSFFRGRIPKRCRPLTDFESRKPWVHTRVNTNNKSILEISPHGRRYPDFRNDEDDINSNSNSNNDITNLMRRRYKMLKLCPSFGMCAACHRSLSRLNMLNE